MDTGEKLNAEMMKKLYEAYKLDTKEKIDEFNEAARKIISDKEYPEAEDILKLVEGKLITDNHERRIHDPSGKQVLNVFFDEPYPVMMPEDEKMMREMSNEIREKFQDYVESETGIPRETITIDSIPENVREKAEHDAILYGDSFVPVCRAPRWIEQYLETQRWINGIRDPEIDVLTGCSQNFKPQQEYDKLEVVFNMLDADKPDKNGRIWKREFMNKILNNRVFLTAPRGHKSWMWLKLLEMEMKKSYEANLVQTLETPSSTKWDINSVIHMHWPTPDLSDLKINDPRCHSWGMRDGFPVCIYGSHIERMALEDLAVIGPDLNSGYGLSTTPNLNDIDKKRLERIIKKGRKHK